MKLWRFQPWGRYNISQATRVAGWSWINWLLSIATLDPTYDFILSQSDMTECQHVKTMTPTGLPFSSREIPSGLGGRLDTIITIGLAFNVVALTPQLAKCIGPAMKRLWYCGFTWDTGISGRKWRSNIHINEQKWFIHPKWFDLGSNNPTSPTILCVQVRCQSLAQSLWCLAEPGHRARKAGAPHTHIHTTYPQEIEWVSIHCPWHISEKPSEYCQLRPPEPHACPFKGENTHQKQAKTINSRQILSVFVLLGPFLVP